MSERIVQFTKPFHGNRDRVVCVIGGIEFTRDTKLEAIRRAIELLEAEMSELRAELAGTLEGQKGEK